MTRIILPAARRQRGAALAIVLILLLIMTLLALASLRGTLMGERMSANMFDRSIAFQAAEAALREGEEEAAATKPVPSAGCADGLCGMPDPTEPADLERGLAGDAFWNTTATREIDVDIGGRTTSARFIVELMSQSVPDQGQCTTSGDVSPDAACQGDGNRYRITARSADADGSEVLLQSIYAVP